MLCIRGEGFWSRQRGNHEAGRVSQGNVHTQQLLDGRSFFSDVAHWNVYAKYVLIFLGHPDFRQE